MIAAELMTPDPIRVSPQQSLADCATLLARHHIRHLPVTDDDGVVLGVVADHTVFEHGLLSDAGDWIAHDEGGAGLLHAAELATMAHTVRSGEALSTAIARLVDIPTELLVVVDAHLHAVGVITEHDGLRLAQGALPIGQPAFLPNDTPPPLVSIERHLPAREGLERMLAAGVRHLLVTDKNVLVGVISYRDLIEDRAHIQPHPMMAAEVVRQPTPFTLSPQTSLRRAAQLMVRHKIGCLPVVDAQQRPLGVVTRTDLLRALLGVLLAEEAVGTYE